MARIVSFVAKPPDHISLNDSLKHGDGNLAIEAIYSRMLDAKADVHRAAYVRDIAVTLKDLKDTPPDIVQIIGHGSPGRLQLGQYWHPEYFHEKYGYPILDSNPLSYGVLSRWLKSTTRVILIGCLVGSSQSVGGVANGPTLLFDLEQMSKGSAYAADALVGPADFGGGILYQGSLIGSNGKPANPIVVPSDKPPIRTVGGQPLKFKRLIGAPELGLFGNDNLDLLLPDDLSRALNERFVEIHPEQPLLAMTELYFEVDGVGEPVELICAGRYTRYFDHQMKKTRYFADLNSPSGGSRSALDTLLDAVRAGARESKDL